MSKTTQNILKNLFLPQRKCKFHASRGFFPLLLGFVLVFPLGSNLRGSLQGSEFLTMKGVELHLDGKRFTEISFNKFDLVLQLLADVEGKGGFGKNPAQAAETALRDLSMYGFKTLRVFAFCGSGSVFSDPIRKIAYLKALDRSLDLCDQYNLRMILCLNTHSPPFFFKIYLIKFWHDMVITKYLPTQAEG